MLTNSRGDKEERIKFMNKVFGKSKNKLDFFFDLRTPLPELLLPLMFNLELDPVLHNSTHSKSAGNFLPKTKAIFTYSMTCGHYYNITITDNRLVNCFSAWYI